MHLKTRRRIRNIIDFDVSSYRQYPRLRSCIGNDGRTGTMLACNVIECVSNVRACHANEVKCQVRAYHVRANESA